MAEELPRMDDRRIGIAALAAILMVLPIQLVVHRVVGAEPYPGLYMPPFAGVPQRGDDVVVPRLTVVARTDTGTEEIDPVELVPNDTRLAESIAGFFFADEAAVRAVASNGWLDRRLRELGVDATQLDVVRKRLYLDRTTHRVSGFEVLSNYSVEITRTQP